MLDGGAVKDTVAVPVVLVEPIPARADTPVGTPGIGSGVTGAEAADVADPIAVRTVTTKVY